MELAIISKDFSLLNKMRKDLIEVGYKEEREWNERTVSQMASYPITFLSVTVRFGGVDKQLALYTHTSDDNNRTTLTPDNYDTILNRCIDNLKKSTV